MTTDTQTRLVELPGTALMYGPQMMREQRWSWTPPPFGAYVLKTPEGEDAAILRLFARMLSWDKRALRAVGIGGVWTRPDLRGQGYAANLLKQVVDRLREAQSAVDVVILHSKPRTLYTLLGFEELIPGLMVNVLHGDITLGAHLLWSVQPEEWF